MLENTFKTLEMYANSHLRKCGKHLVYANILTLASNDLEFDKDLNDYIKSLPKLNAELLERINTISPRIVAGEANIKDWLYWTLRCLIYSRFYNIDRYLERLFPNATKKMIKYQMTDIAFDIFGNPLIKQDDVSIEVDDNVYGIVKDIQVLNEKVVAQDRMLVLSDALEEGGYNDPIVLEHCRRSKYHYRGCWLISKILNVKENVECHGTLNQL